MSITIHIAKSSLNDENIFNDIKHYLKENLIENNVLFLFFENSKTCITLSDKKFNNLFNFNRYTRSQQQNKFKSPEEIRKVVSSKKQKISRKLDLKKNKNFSKQFYYDECSSDASNSAHESDSEELSFYQHLESAEETVSEEQSATDEQIETDKQTETDSQSDFSLQTGYQSRIVSSQENDFQSSIDQEEKTNYVEQGILTQFSSSEYESDQTEKNNSDQTTESDIIIDLQKSSVQSSVSDDDDDDDSLISIHEDNSSFFESDESYVPEKNK